MSSPLQLKYGLFSFQTYISILPRYPYHASVVMPSALTCLHFSYNLRTVRLYQIHFLIGVSIVRIIRQMICLSLKTDIIIALFDAGYNLISN